MNVGIKRNKINLDSMVSDSFYDLRRRVLQTDRSKSVHV